MNLDQARRSTGLPVWRIYIISAAACTFSAKAISSVPVSSARSWMEDILCASSNKCYSLPGRYRGNSIQGRGLLRKHGCWMPVQPMEIMESAASEMLELPSVIPAVDKGSRCYSAAVWAWESSIRPHCLGGDECTSPSP